MSQGCGYSTQSGIWHTQDNTYHHPHRQHPQVLYLINHTQQWIKLHVMAKGISSSILKAGFISLDLMNLVMSFMEEATPL